MAGPRLAAMVIAFIALLAPLMAAAAKLPDHIVVETASGQHRFSVEWATTAAERERGLMFRQQMAADHGMIFDFGNDQTVAFWMKNTPLALDMVFIAADGTVRRVQHDARPYSLDVIPSGAPVRYVFEILGGTAGRLGIEAGSRVEIPEP